MQTSKFTGVCYQKRSKNFRVRVYVKKAIVLSGYFYDELEAAHEYDKCVRENNLPYKLNFPDPEPFNPIPNTRLIRLTQGKFTIVDEDDFEYLNQWKWHVLDKGSLLYATRNIRINGKRRAYYMHQDILNSDLTDHIDHDGLNNQRSNLRPSNKSRNAMNNRKCKNTSSTYKGVYLFRRTGKWHSRITINGEAVHLGFFADETDAAKAYNDKAMELFGEYANLNTF